MFLPINESKANHLILPLFQFPLEDQKIHGQTQKEPEMYNIQTQIGPVYSLNARTGPGQYQEVFDPGNTVLIRNNFKSAISKLIYNLL